uniref:Zinc finger homeobox 3 n=1 Tax=Accipiter nisus TaxID=211598 RepID=A0A8B9MM57_9AVES
GAEEALGNQPSGAEREPKRALPFRKGPNFTMEKFLDPSRPYKCTVCKESFTQKNILLVHYNSVSHLHKLKRALQESATGQPEPTSSPDNKPFKCNTCNVAYSQSSTLEIHMRSVLHQTKARAAKLEAAGGSGSSNGAGNSSSSSLSLGSSTPTALLQSQLFNPALLPHFPMTTETLLQLQQQQHLLFPFYIPSAEFQLNPEVSLPVTSGPLPDNLKPKEKKDFVPGSSSEPSLLPPRIASDARGNATKALLENFGFELVIQYNENKQKVQKKNGKTEQGENLEKLECDTCGKFFSNILILKSHQEHVHQHYFPFKQLERFAKQYREHYDKLYPLRPQTPEPPPPPPPPPPPLPPAPPQPASTPTIPTSAPPITSPTIAPAHKRSSRTRFTDYQLRVLQDFFDANAYPKDDEFEQLSNLLNLPTRVIVVWFQNARQKARKNYENQGEGKDGERRDLVFQRIFDLIKHQKKLCYKDEDEDGQDDIEATDEKPKQSEPPSTQQNQTQEKQVQPKQESQQQQDQGEQKSSSLIPYQCDQCKLAFPSFEHWQEHQQLHFLSAQNHQLLSGTLPQIPASSATSPSTPTSTMNTLKRKLEEKASASPGENDSGTGGEEPQRDKRLRTTITPEQLEILYQKYLLDSNPTRKMLDHIAHEVGLKKRVVQVWFQNTRARERKGQFRAVGPAQAHRRCPFCRALFKAKTALEAHIRSRIVTETKSASGPSEGLTKAAMIAMSEYEDRLSSGLVSPAPSFYSKEYDNEGTVDYSETSSLADPCSPSPGASGSASKSGESGDRPGQKRFRTQMTNLQLKVLKSCFNDYRTPTMLECEVLGNDIGLPKRVVQVWFQNARAKEKKSKLSMAKHFGINQTSYEGPKTECTLCGIKYSARLSVRDHIFSQQHISKVKETIGSQLDKEKEYFDPATVPLNLPAQPPAALSSPTPAQATAAVAPQQPPATTPQPQPQQPPPPQRKEKESEKAKEKEKAPKGKGDPLPGPKKEKGEASAGALSAPLPTMEYAVEPAQLQALQAALNSDPTTLLTSQFLPYFVPGFSPYYAPQIPGALQSGYLQPMYGMEGLFPYSPALSQALLGLSPGSLLQQYQQYQQKPPKQEEQKNAPREVSPLLPKPQEEPEAEGKGADSLCDPFIVPKVQYKLVCRKCQAGFGDQEAASDHLKSLCFFGQSVANLQEMVLHVPTGSGQGSGSYQCVACESTVCGDEALSQHLESAPHKHRTITRAARNAKEHPSLLPHSACPPDPSTASTSQSIVALEMN